MGRASKSGLYLKMKKLEGQFYCGRVEPRKPFVVRLDGKNFSAWTRGFDKPFDKRLVEVFQRTTLQLFSQLENLRLAYGQSDEVSLLFYPKRPNSKPPFGGKFYKILSLTASIFTAHFNKQVQEVFGERPLAYFDARIIVFDKKDDVIEYFKWRFLDAIRNSKNSFVRMYLTPRKMFGKTSNELVDIVRREFGADYYELPVYIRNGWVVYEVKTEKGRRQLKISSFERFVEEFQPVILTSLEYTSG